MGLQPQVGPVKGVEKFTQQQQGVYSLACMLCMQTCVHTKPARAALFSAPRRIDKCNHASRLSANRDLDMPRNFSRSQNEIPG